MRFWYSIFVLTAIAGTASPAFANKCDNSGSQVKKSWCYSHLGKYLESEMVSAYRMADARARDYEKRISIGTRGMAKKLQLSQIAFEKFRAAQCEFSAARLMGGSGTGIANLMCRNELTRNRINYLNGFAGVN